jgi:hypothetical protein
MPPQFGPAIEWNHRFVWSIGASQPNHQVAGILQTTTATNLRRLQTAPFLVAVVTSLQESKLVHQAGWQTTFVSFHRRYPLHQSNVDLQFNHVVKGIDKHFCDKNQKFSHKPTIETPSKE